MATRWEKKKARMWWIRRDINPGWTEEHWSHQQEIICPLHGRLTPVLQPPLSSGPLATLIVENSAARLPHSFKHRLSHLIYQVCQWFQPFRVRWASVMASIIPSCRNEPTLTRFTGTLDPSVTARHTLHRACHTSIHGWALSQVSSYASSWFYRNLRNNEEISISHFNYFSWNLSPNISISLLVRKF